MTYDRLLEGHSPEVREVFQAACDLARDVMPDATEQLDMPDHLVAFGFGDPGGGVRMRGFAVALIPHGTHVNVQLADGADLADAEGIVEGTGKRIRHVKCRNVADVRRPALRTLMVDQADRRRAQGGGTP